MPLYTLKWLKFYKLRILKYGKEVEQVEFPYTDGDILKWYNHFGKLFRSFSQS